ncbi:MAG: pyridoxal-phosphate dependent enzyme, partial [Sideroxyarcus sp.]|nr:pyridoxal-phosphate dependent enzyme [Sideroxyarcus sp.]
MPRQLEFLLFSFNLIISAFAESSSFYEIFQQISLKHLFSANAEIDLPCESHLTPIGACDNAAMPTPPTLRAWEHDAVARIEADFQRSADTHLIALPLPGFAQHGIDLYLKDESTHPTGSLKHRLARSLFLYALCNGWLREGSTVVESSSGSTAVSEAYFARLLGLPFVAVMPRST